MILNPVGKAKSMVLTEEGERRCRELFESTFVSADDAHQRVDLLIPPTLCELRRAASYAGSFGAQGS